MPSVRFSRDKRGYEYVYLVHTPIKRGKPGRTRVLYWYRTPPGVRIGRKPFDDEVQRTLERQNPGLTFDWDAIINTPMPPPDMTEFWRERRRAEKAARQERRAIEAEEVAPEQARSDQPSNADEGDALAAIVEGPAQDAEPGGALDEIPGEREASPDTITATDERVIAAPEAADVHGGPRKRRRRRGGRRRRPAADGTGQAVGGTDVSPADLEAGRADDTIDSDDQSDPPESTSEEE